MKDQTIDYVLRTTWLAVQKLYNEEAAKVNSTISTGFALLSIDRKTGISSSALGPKLGMEATSLSRTLKTMEEKGLIERHPNPNDGRGVIIKLTPLGLEKRNYSKDIVLKFNEIVKSNLSQIQLKHFYEVASVITDLVSNKKIFTEDNDN